MAKTGGVDPVVVHVVDVWQKGTGQGGEPAMDQLRWNCGPGPPLCSWTRTKGYAGSNLDGSSRIGRLRTVGEGVHHRNR